MNIFQKAQWFRFTVIALFFVGCGHQASHPNQHDYHHLSERIQAESYDSHSYPAESYDLRDISYEAVRLNELKRQEFFVETRKDKMLHFECNECHSVALEKMGASMEDSLQNAHWDIELMHAGSESMDCQTCHNPSNLNSLQSLNEQEIDFNHSYKLCGQCHSTQLKDWVGAAHGKRLGGWVEPRIIKNCSGCHNPHKPKFEKRWPARLNTKNILEDQKLESKN